MLNYFKNDYAKVRAAMLFVTNGKMPQWLSIVLYVLLLPLGLALMPFALVYVWYINRQIKKMMDE